MRTIFISLSLMLWTLSSFAEEVSYTDKVVVITVGEKDLVNKQSFKFWRRTLERVNEEKAKAVIFQLDTPGGLAIQTKDIMVNELRDLEVPSYAFVDDEAISAGALISVATDEIWMTPGSTIGAAAIVNGTGAEIGDTMRAKLESFFDANVRAVTKDKGHPTEIVKMMMFIDDEDRKYGPIEVKKGSLLTLTAEEAVTNYKGNSILAEGIVKDRNELIEVLGFDSSEVMDATQTGFEKLAWYIAFVSPILILIGIGAVYFEMKTPGTGIGAVIALIAFGIFFFGNNVAGNLAGYEVIAIFVAGLIFVIIEIFVFPGIIFGVLGALMMIGALLFSMVDRFDFKDIGSVDFITGDKSSWLGVFATPLLLLSIGLIGSIILIYYLMKYLPKVSIPGIILNREIGRKESGATDSEMKTDGLAATDLIGKEGKATMDLRPAGKVSIDGKTIDVITGGEFIKKGTRVKVVAQEKMRTVVEKV